MKPCQPRSELGGAVGHFPSMSPSFLICKWGGNLRPDRATVCGEAGGFRSSFQGRMRYRSSLSPLHLAQGQGRVWRGVWLGAAAWQGSVTVTSCYSSCPY